MKPTVKISQKDLRSVVQFAKGYLLDTPIGARLPGGDKDLTEGERLAVAYINATLTVANGLGGETSHIAVVFDDSEVQPA